MNHQQAMECRVGVRVGEPSTLSQIVPPPREEGRHVRWSSRSTPTADWWVLMIKDQTGPGRHRVGLSVEGIKLLASGKHPRVDPR
ncbi:hypothetical protein PBI_COOPER_78 [Mycobacterium phage Cooper]|uniref:Uncharacterized protein n=1 Tax=Mycobacterium phage Cooper TaxID=373406 RepID=Q1A038_9CAUD|nr:HNH endonuclease [Mycobacterium phage Cooper]ABD58195.1 hypothetical protein PBI_COOPER_78 [Mycobacterium phage Cooper]